MNVCFLCKNSLREGEVCAVKARGVKSLLQRSIDRGDEHKKFLREANQVEIHKTCYKHYSDPRHVAAANAAKATSLSSTSSPTSPSAIQEFDFSTNCFICSKPVLSRSWSDKRTYKPVTKNCVRDHVLNALRDVNDEFSIQIINRIEGIPDLTAVGAKYHSQCSQKLYRSHQRKSITKTEESRLDRVEVAMADIYSYLSDNSDECQFTITELAQQIKGTYIPDSRTIKARLLKRFQEDVKIVEQPSQNAIVFYVNTGRKVLTQSWYENRKSDPQEERIRVVKEAAAIILQDIRSLQCNISDYPPPDKFTENVENLVPKTLNIFMSEIISKKKRGNVDKLNRKCTAISHAIVAAARPRSYISPLQVGVGAFLFKKYASRNLINVLSALGFSSSYKEILRFEASCLSRSENVLLPNAFSQFVFDNADFNVNTLDGRGTFHAMGGIQCVTPHDALQPSTIVSRSEKRKSATDKGILAHVPLLAYNKTKGSGLNTVEVADIDKMCFLSHEITLTPGDFMWLYGKWACIPGITGWNGFMIEATTEQMLQKSKVLYLPFINVPPSEYNAIYTSLVTAIKRTKASHHSTCIVTFDQPLYWKAKDIVAAANPDSDVGKVIVRLGGFHLLMSFMGSIGYVMSGSGLEDLLKMIYAENSVDHIMSGHAYSRALRAHILVHLTLGKKVMDLIDLTDEEREALDLAIFDIDKSNIFTMAITTIFKTIMTKFEEEIQRIETRGPTAKLWIQYFKMVTLVKQFIEAERSGDWALHLVTVKKMLPFFYATGHHLYAKSSHLYLQEMLRLDKKMPANEYHDFTIGGKFTIRRTSKFWSGISSDQTIEQTLMRQMHSIGGLTHGRGISHSTIASWILGMKSMLDVCEHMEVFCGLMLGANEQHVDYRDSRVSRDNEDREKLDNWIASHEPFLEGTELVAISTGLVGDPRLINCHLSEETGKAMLSKVVEQHTFGSLSYRRKDKVLPLAALSSSIKIDDIPVPINPLLLFQRISFTKHSDKDMQDYLAYELAPYPLSLFSDEGMRKGTKSSLYNAFSPMDHVDLGEKRYFVIDGGFLMHKVVWDRGVTIKAICDKYVKYVKGHFGTSVKIVFDGYSDDPEIAGTKTWERLRRTKNQRYADVIFTSNTVPTTTQEKFLANEKNKAKFIQLLRREFEDCDFTVEEALGDADYLIVHSAIEESHFYDSVTIVAEDIDILVLLTALGRNCANVFLCKPGKLNTKEQHYSTSCLKHGDAVSKHILFLHAFSGCDTTSAAYGMGKVKFLKTLEKTPTLESAANHFVQKDVDADIIALAGEQFFIALYGGDIHKDKSINLLRYKHFAKSLVKSTFNLASLPPTKDTARMHAFRTYHQVQSWLGNDTLPAEKWGWKKRGRTFTPVPSTEPPAPTAIIKLISCGCKTKCGKACGCRKAGLKCTAICSICAGESCENVQEISRMLATDEDEYQTSYDDDIFSLPEFVSRETQLNKGNKIDDSAMIGIDDAEPGPSKRPREV